MSDMAILLGAAILLALECTSLYIGLRARAHKHEMMRRLRVNKPETN